MRKLMVRNDGPPDYEWIGSFDDFQTEFSVSRIVEEKLTSDNKQMDAIALLKKIRNSLIGMKWQYAGKSTDTILNEVGEFLEKIAQQHH